MPRAIKQRKTEEGFTLIEIMVVLVILGALAVISVPVYSNYVRRAKISEAISNVEAFANAIRIFKMENGSWPQKSELTSGTSKVVDINETYFNITWTRPSSTESLIINISPNTLNFDATGNFRYTMTTEYKGSWDDSPSTSTGLLHTYAPYLLPKSTTY